MKCPRCYSGELIKGACNTCQASYGMADIDAITDVAKAREEVGRLMKENNALRQRVNDPARSFTAVQVRVYADKLFLYETIRGKLTKRKCHTCGRSYRAFIPSFTLSAPNINNCAACAAVIDDNIERMIQRQTNPAATSDPAQD